MFSKPSRFVPAVVVALGLLLSARQIARADDVDPVHSFVVFSIHHMNAGYVWGRFNDPTGKITMDDSDPGKCSLEASVETAKIDTGNEMRDNDLRGANFLNVKQYPTITFKSTTFKKTGDDTYDVTGDLTLHGATNSITVQLHKTGEGKGMKGETRAGWETTFSIKRSDYNMAYALPMIGDEVRLSVALEAIKK